MFAKLLHHCNTGALLPVYDESQTVSSSMSFRTLSPLPVLSANWRKRRRYFIAFYSDSSLREDFSVAPVDFDTIETLLRGTIPWLGHSKKDWKRVYPLLYHKAVTYIRPSLTATSSHFHGGVRTFLCDVYTSQRSPSLPRNVNVIYGFIIQKRCKKSRKKSFFGKKKSTHWDTIRYILLNIFICLYSWGIHRHVE